MSQASNEAILDKPVNIRQGEELDVATLSAYMRDNIPGMTGEAGVLQFPSGFSNLTYMVTATVNGKQQEYVLRRPPFGANVKSAHDMEREFKVLRMLRSVYPKVPNTIVFCGDESILGAQFYIMERVQGIILRAKPPVGVDLNSSVMKRLSEMTIDNMADLHACDISNNELQHFGKPEGYVRRQVEGWVKRYHNARTDDIPTMEYAAEWLLANIPDEATANPPALIHNDYKYDNVVFSPDLSAISAVLDWEMATIGDPLMDLGTTLAWWAEAGDPMPLQMFGLTPLPGNLNRQELLERYAEKTGRNVSNMLFYYAFGVFKNSVVAQQIYARFKQGFTKDPRFAGLIYVIQASGDIARKAIDTGKIRQ